MPDPVSDSYDPEFSTGENCQLIRDAMDEAYDRLSAVLGRRPPIFILNLVRDCYDMQNGISATLTEKEWRLLRWAVERAKNSV